MPRRLDVRRSAARRVVDPIAVVAKIVVPARDRLDAADHPPVQAAWAGAERLVAGSAPRVLPPEEERQRELRSRQARAFSAPQAQAQGQA
jgi:hypothetical protein